MVRPGGHWGFFFGRSFSGQNNVLFEERAALGNLLESYLKRTLMGYLFVWNSIEFHLYFNIFTNKLVLSVVKKNKNTFSDENVSIFCEFLN